MERGTWSINTEEVTNNVAGQLTGGTVSGTQAVLDFSSTKLALITLLQKAVFLSQMAFSIHFL